MSIRNASLRSVLLRWLLVFSIVGVFVACSGFSSGPVEEKVAEASSELARSDCELFGFGKATTSEEPTWRCAADNEDVGPGLTMRVFFNCRKADQSIWFLRYSWYHCLNGVQHPWNEGPYEYVGYGCALLDGECVIQTDLPEYPIGVDPDSVEGMTLRALYQNLQQTEARVRAEGGATLEERLKLIEAAGLLGDLADVAFTIDHREVANQSVSLSRRLGDLAWDFTPGLSLTKDVITLLSGVNPITGEEASNPERAMILGTLVVPGFLKGGAKGLVKAAGALEEVAKSSKKSAAIAGQIATVVRNSDDELRDLAKISSGSRIAGEVTAEIAEQAQHVSQWLRSGNVGFGNAPRMDYVKTYRDTFAHLNGEIGQVHHAVEQQVLTRYPGVITPAEIHSLENLRGIRRGQEGTSIHQSEIRMAWNEFYEVMDGLGRTPTKDELLQFAKKLDDKYGAEFIPPVR